MKGSESCSMNKLKQQRDEYKLGHNITPFQNQRKYQDIFKINKH